MPPLPRPVPRVPSDLSRNNLVVGVGDSITANGGAYPLVVARSWLAWAALKSGGRVRLAGWKATGGLTTAQILSTHIPQVLAMDPRPAYCTVLAGTNDTPAVGGGLIAAGNLTTMYRSLRANKITPILCTIPPRSENNPSYKKERDIINAFVARYAAANGLPFVDMHAVLVDPETAGWYLSGYDADAVHPSEQGAEAMGDALLTVLQGIVPPRAAYLNRDNESDALRASNPLFLTDSNADGIPDPWSRTGDAGEGTWSIVSGSPDIVGNWAKVVKTSGTAETGISLLGVIVDAGDTLQWCGKLRVSGLAANAAAYVAIANGNNPNTVYASAMYGWKRATGIVTFELEATVPDGVTTIQVNVYISGGTGTIEIGQSTLRNLTTIGLDALT